MSNEPRDPCRAYRMMARQNALANMRLHRACARLRPGEWSARREAPYPSIQATLNHLYNVDLFFLEALLGVRDEFEHAEDAIPFPDLSDLTAAQEVLDRQLVKFCDRLRHTDLGRVVKVRREGTVQQEPMCAVLVHHSLHAVHHRGQVHAMLSATSVAPPRLDQFVAREDASQRVDDMKRMGWSEEYLAS